MASWTLGALFGQVIQVVRSPVGFKRILALLPAICRGSTVLRLSIAELGPFE